MNKLGVAVACVALLSAGFMTEPGGCGTVSLDSRTPGSFTEAASVAGSRSASDLGGVGDAASSGHIDASADWKRNFENQDSGVPDGWYSTGGNNSLAESHDLYQVAQVDGSNVFGTSSTFTNTHSHFVSDDSASWSNYKFWGVMMRDSGGGGVGVTFLSDYPNSDQYYRLRVYGSNTFELEPHGTTLSGTTVSDVAADSGVWYHFMVRVNDDGSATHVQAKVWPDGSAAPSDWQLDAYDSSATRRTTGTVGVWAMDAGGKWVDNLAISGLADDETINLVADAGPDQTQSDQNADGFETVLLDGSGSAGDISLYMWIDGSNVIAQGTSPIANVSLPVGFHTITLQVTNGSVVDSDTVGVTIEPADFVECQTSSQNWTNFDTGDLGGLFTVNFAAIPNSDNMDGIFGLSDGPGSAYSAFAVMVRFNTSGTIDVRNGGVYSADTTVAYTAGDSFDFRLVVNCAQKIYSVYVTPEGGVERQIASNYAFRTEQANCQGLNNWALQSGAGTDDICNVTFDLGSTSGPMEPVANAGANQSVMDLDDNGSEVVMLDGRESYDPDGTIVTYKWSEGSTVLASGSSATSNVSLSVGTHNITLLVTDDSGDQDSDSTTVSVTSVGGGGEVTMQSSVSRHGITWTFDHTYPVGEFANGDFFVVGPVNVTAISPAPGGGSNGSMINPTGEDVQAYDSRAYQYNASYGVTPPLTLHANESLVSTDSASGGYTHIDTAAVLTCLASAPPAGTFRPPYCGDSKPLHNVAQLRMNLLPALPPVSGTPSAAEVASNIERLWLDHQPNWHGKYLHPQQNMPSYGREMATEINDAALVTLLNVPNKDIVVLRLVQLGIDFNGIADAGGGWAADGGHASGRKWPIIFAGYMLNDAHMLSIGDRSTTFGEDCQTFYVSQADVNRGVGYTQGDIGLPEWGIRHCYWPEQDNPEWTAPYRQCCTANTWVGAVLSAHILGLTDEWNHQVIFDYQDRFMATESPGSFRSWSPFAGSMWDTYR